MFVVLLSFFFFKQKTAYEMRISDWSSDVCSSDLAVDGPRAIDAVLLQRPVAEAEEARRLGCPQIAGRHPAGPIVHHHASVSSPRSVAGAVASAITGAPPEASEG